MTVRSGAQEGYVYSLSRWTDVSGSANKWEWFVNSLKKGEMLAIDPKTGIPGRWSLKPEDTLGLVWWTKDPQNLIYADDLLKDYKVKIHVTVTGWEEVEKGAPGLYLGAAALYTAVSTYGAENVTWRFSPVPMVPDVVERFDTIAHIAAEAGLQKVFLSFLQTNDRVPETRDPIDRLNLLVQMAERAERLGISVKLCNEDRLLAKVNELPANLGSGVCAPPEEFQLPGFQVPASEGCGCTLMVDPFTINESCNFGCTYCYASDKSLSDKKRNTTRLKVLY